MTLFAANELQCIVSWEETPQKCPFPLGFRHSAGGGPSHGHRQHAQKISQRSRVHRYPVGQTLLITILGKSIRYAGKQHAEQLVYAWFSATVFTILTPAAKKTSTAAAIRQEDSKVLRRVIRIVMPFSGTCPPYLSCLHSSDFFRPPGKPVELTDQRTVSKKVWTFVQEVSSS